MLALHFQFFFNFPFVFIPDLTPLNLQPFRTSSQLLAVGWLEPGCEIPTGPIDNDFAVKLSELFLDPWEPMHAMGRHSCGFCRLSGGPTTFHLENSAKSAQVAVGAANLWLPGEGVLYVAPSLILHYMDAHEYAPPLKFQAAVVACPPMRSMAYLKAILKNCPENIAARLRNARCP